MQVIKVHKGLAVNVVSIKMCENDLSAGGDYQDHIGTCVGSTRVKAFSHRK